MKNILKLATTGSVDDGKSTLIGRLLYDTKSLPRDRLDSIEKVSRKRGNGELDLSLITDGLMDEREQGITIDVAHIYFHSQQRKFIIADTPGHVEYTRNMITGASQSQVSLILIDARKGVLEQTKRHLFIAHLLRMQKVLVVVNKMDLVDYSEKTFYNIASSIQDYVKQAELQLDPEFVPVSSKAGDNVVNASEQLSWFKGDTLLDRLNALEVADEDLPGRFMVQLAIRPQSDEHHDFRGYAGKVKSGSFKVGQAIDLEQGRNSEITSILRGTEEVDEANAGESVNITLKDDIDLSRGNWMFEEDTVPQSTREVKAQIAWLNSDPLQQQVKYILQHGVQRVQTKVSSIDEVWDIEAGEKNVFDGTAPGLNDLFTASLKLSAEIHADRFEDNRSTGSFILIHPQTHQTVAVGTIL